MKAVKSSLPPKRRRPRSQAKAAESGAGAGGGGGASDAAAGAGEGRDDKKGEPEGAAVVDKHTLCVEVLVSGYVQSYVDFFYLTHRPDPNPDAPGGKDAEIDVDIEDMHFIKENLTRAEAARRKGDTASVYEAYNNLALYYQGAADPKTGIYFYEKCLEISRLTGDARGEMEANHNLGVAYEALDNVPSAIKFHERHLDLAKKQEDDAGERQANAELVKLYRRRAEALETEGRLDDACELHMRCLVASQACGDRLAEGLANYRAGRVYVLLGETLKGVPFLENYLEITKELEGQDEGQGAAYAALAAAYQSLKQPEKAVDCLEQFLRIAEETGNLAAQSEACSNLGVIFNRRGEFDRAVEYFAKAYELTRTHVSSGAGRRKDLDTARVNLGMARGNAQMGAYMNVINYDVSSLLLWKNRRAPFEGDE